MKPVTPDQRKILQWFDDRSGDGYIDRFGRIVAAGETTMKGQAGAILALVAKGMIEGGGDRLRITPNGRRFLKDSLPK